jgi:hypothetical protein
MYMRHQLGRFDRLDSRTSLDEDVTAVRLLPFDRTVSTEAVSCIDGAKHVFCKVARL